MLVYRIAHKKHSDHLFAPGFAGRWNGAGKKVLYCSESIPVAFLESMIRRQGVGFNRDYNIVIIEIPDDLAIHAVQLSDLTGEWRTIHDYTICQKIGNAWFDSFKQPVLKVPSAIVVQSYNYVLHAQHTDYSGIRVAGVTELVPDARIDELLKSYKN
ncbi:MAG: RES family NAD+ phosphorylase [Bacteroidota bacterium]|nr:RES family NAD+ phosphorylase [Bacteroidota bacterium]